MEKDLIGYYATLSNQLHMKRRKRQRECICGFLKEILHLYVERCKFLVEHNFDTLSTLKRSRVYIGEFYRRDNVIFIVIEIAADDLCYMEDRKYGAINEVETELS